MKRPNGMGSVYLRGDTWWIKYHRYGKPFRESAHTDNRRKAERFLKFRLAQLENHSFVGPQVERITVDELAEDYLRDYRINGYKSWETAETRWRVHLKPCFGGMRAVDVAMNGDCLSRYVDKRQQEGAKNGTINRELAAFKRMFSLGIKDKKVRQMPDYPHLEEHGVRRGFVEDTQYERLAQACSKRGLWLRAMFEVAYTLGWRAGELLAMRVSQVNLAERTLRLDDSKNGEPRVAVMTPLV
jgi:integrase